MDDVGRVLHVWNELAGADLEQLLRAGSLCCGGTSGHLHGRDLWLPARLHGLP